MMKKISDVFKTILEKMILNEEKGYYDIPLHLRVTFSGIETTTDSCYKQELLPMKGSK